MNDVRGWGQNREGVGAFIVNDVRGVGSKQGRCGSIHHVNDVTTLLGCV